MDSDEEVDKIISLKKIDLKKALPIVGDISMEARNAQRSQMSQLALERSKEREGVMSKVSSIIKRKIVFDDDGEEIEEELKPLIEIDDGLNNLYVPKY